MKTKFISSVLVLAFLACPIFAYCQDLNTVELSIFYDVSEDQFRDQVSGKDSLSAAGLAAKYSISEDKLQDIMLRGWKMPLDSQETVVAGELKQQLSGPNGEQLTLADWDKMKDIALKHNMSLGHVCSVYVRMNSDLL